MPQRILFVDDNPLMLAGLGRMLRPMRHEWEMTFAAGGTAALSALETASFQAVVADMRMPDIDGADLLQHVERVQPGAMRIILTGHTTHDAGLRSVQAAHQCMSKPCNAGTLSARLNRVFARRTDLGDGDVAAAVSAITTLPSRPEAYRRLMAELEAPARSTQRILEIVAADLGMTCKILQVVHSGLFPDNAHAAASLAGAVRGIGSSVIRQLALVPGAFSVFNCETLMPLVDELTGCSQELPYPADVGRLALATVYGARYRHVLMRAREEQVALSQVERDDLGTSHEEVGAYLLALWGIPSNETNHTRVSWQGI